MNSESSRAAHSTLLGWLIVALAAPAQAVQSSEAPPREDAPEITIGDGRFIRDSGLDPAGRDQRLPGGGFSTAFRDAEVTTVVNQVLGDFLGLDFTVDKPGQTQFSGINRDRHSFPVMRRPPWRGARASK
ncbi:hypothetical protein [Maricaulis sp. CAU 1757]